MIKIGIISDTHIPTRCQAVSKEVLRELEGVNLILHAGDFVDISTFNALTKIAPVKAVYGNMDHEEVKSKFPKKEIIKVGKFNIGLIHDLGSPSKRLKTLKEEFGNFKISAVVFGHSHTPLNKKKDGILFFNPGSPTDDVFAPYKSIGILTVSDKIEGRIIELKK